MSGAWGECSLVSVVLVVSRPRHVTVWTDAEWSVLAVAEWWRRRRRRVWLWVCDENHADSHIYNLVTPEAHAELQTSAFQ